jgi:hypothetical protein
MYQCAKCLGRLYVNADNDVACWMCGARYYALAPDTREHGIRVARSEAVSRRKYVALARARQLVRVAGGS